ncbi:hypothetical protein CP02DC23_1232A, partial [Chlamydia psittaci 02DC23]
MLEGVWSVYTH